MVVRPELSVPDMGFAVGDSRSSIAAAAAATPGRLPSSREGAASLGASAGVLIPKPAISSAAGFGDCFGGSLVEAAVVVLFLCSSGIILGEVLRCRIAAASCA